MKSYTLFHIFYFYIFLFIVGHFNLENAKAEAVDHITDDAPSKYRESSHIVRWELPKHNGRVLYTLFENEKAREIWLKSFEEIQSVSRD